MTNKTDNKDLYFDALKEQRQFLLTAMTRLNTKIEDLQSKLNSNQPQQKNHSDNLIDLAIALAKTQSEIEIAGKSAAGYNFKYADLAEIIKASRPYLSKNGLSVLQPIISNKATDKMYLETILLHASGQWIKSSLEIPEIDIAGKTAVQSFGATVTYLRRYSYASLVGVVAAKEEDLDKV